MGKKKSGNIDEKQVVAELFSRYESLLARHLLVTKSFKKKKALTAKEYQKLCKATSPKRFKAEVE